jgi:hypothetical protein
MLEKDRDLHDIFKDWKVENLHIKFCKHLMGVGKKSTNIAVILEFGRYPMYCYTCLAFEKKLTESATGFSPLWHVFKL